MAAGIRYDQIQAEINRGVQHAESDIKGRRRALCDWSIMGCEWHCTGRELTGL